MTANVMCPSCGCMKYCLDHGDYLKCVLCGTFRKDVIVLLDDYRKEKKRRKHEKPVIK